MSTSEPSNLHESESVEDLRARLAEAEETIEAIRHGTIDAVVVYGPQGREAPRVYALETADRTYRTFLEGMNEGAVTLSAEGEIIFANRRFCEMLQVTAQRLMGMPLTDFIAFDERECVERLLKEGQSWAVRSDCTLRGLDGTEIPVRFSVVSVEAGDSLVLCAIVTDLTEQKRTEGQLRSLASDLVLTEERERRRLATLVHDDLGQTLALTKLQLGFLGAKLTEPRLQEELDKIGDSVTQMVSQVRTLTFELSPTILYSQGLGAALQTIIEPLLRADLQIDLEMDEAHRWPLSEEARVTLFRGVRELLVNAVKHAQPHRIAVAAHQQGARLALEVTDDGVGFDPAALPPPGLEGGFGLFNLSERLAQIGGTFALASAPGQGARFTLTVPLTPEP
jgi:PAS domain S-box-containing protein